MLATALSLCLLATPVFVDGARAAALIQGGALVLDARGADAVAPFLPGARVIDWMALRDGWGRTGRLDSDVPRLVERLRALGIEDGRSILVVGAAARGFGEEGRVWWMLRYLGLSSVFVLDGGVEVWAREARPLQDEPSPPRPAAGALSVRLNDALRADWREVDRARRDEAWRVLDVRSAEEWRGGTPYWEARGGHVPGARHLDWRTLLAADGRLRPPAELRAILAASGVRPDTRVVVYCTGGVRSAFAQAVLHHLGYTAVANYDGSWFDWSSRAALPAEK